MRRLPVMLLVLLFAGNAVAISFEGGKQQPVAPPAGQAVKQTNTAPAKTGSSGKSTRPASTFNPTEKIGADSAVSFPVDI